MIATAPAAAPAVAGAAGVMVRLGGAERQLGPEQIGAALDRPAGSYVLRAPGTAGEPIAHPPALSLRALVTLAGGSPDAVSFITVARPNRTLALLERADLADPPPFPEGPPIVWIDAGGTRYFRPLRGPDDANAADNIGVTDGDLIVSVHTGPLLAVYAAVDRTSVAAGEPVGLTANVTGATPGQALSYRWSFGDGTGATGQVVRHRFREPGAYDAVVTVNGSDDSGGSSAPVRIRVGRQRESDHPTGGGGADRRAPARGPARGSGDDDSAPTAEPAPSTGGGDSRRSQAGPAPPPGGTPQPHGAPAPRSRGARAAPPAAARPAPHRRPPKSPGPVVSGTLVAAHLTAPPRAATSESAASRHGGDPASGRLGPAAAVLAAIALVGLGMLRERHGLRAEVAR